MAQPKTTVPTGAQVGVPTPHSYAAHAALLGRLPRHAGGWRGCLGVALLIDGDVVPPVGEGMAGLAFLPNDRLTWVTALDVPVPWIAGLARPAHLMQVRRPALRYGVPSLDQHTVAAEYDYWDGPKPGMPPELVLAFDGLNDAMTSTAFVYRREWREVAAKAGFPGYAGVPAGGPTPILLGDRRYRPDVVKGTTWVPRPWVSVDPANAALAFQRLKARGYTDVFRDVVIDLYAAGMPIASPVEGFFSGTSPLVVDGVRYTQYNFRDKAGGKHALVATAASRYTSEKGLPVLRGTQVGLDGPPVHQDFFHWGRDRQWGAVVASYAPAGLELVLGNVFSAMFRHVKGNWLLPYEVIGPDVSYSFGGGALWWEVSRIMADTDNHNFSFEADGRVHIMPTVWMQRWDEFDVKLGPVATDLMPRHPGFAAHALKRQHRFPRTTTGRTGDGQGEKVPVAVVPGEPVGRMPKLGGDDDPPIAEFDLGGSD